MAECKDCERSAYARLPDVLRAHVASFLEQQEWSRLARASRDAHRVSKQPAASPQLVELRLQRRYVLADFHVAVLGRIRPAHLCVGRRTRSWGQAPPVTAEFVDTLRALAPTLVHLHLRGGVLGESIAALQTLTRLQSLRLRVAVAQVATAHVLHQLTLLRSLELRVLHRNDEVYRTRATERRLFLFAWLPPSLTELELALDLTVTASGSMFAQLPLLEVLQLSHLEPAQTGDVVQDGVQDGSTRLSRLSLDTLLATGVCAGCLGGRFPRLTHLAIVRRVDGADLLSALAQTPSLVSLELHDVGLHSTRWCSVHRLRGWHACTNIRNLTFHVPIAAGTLRCLADRLPLQLDVVDINNMCNEYPGDLDAFTAHRIARLKVPILPQRWTVAVDELVLRQLPVGRSTTLRPASLVLNLDMPDTADRTHQRTLEKDFSGISIMFPGLARLTMPRMTLCPKSALAAALDTILVRFPALREIDLSQMRIGALLAHGESPIAFVRRCVSPDQVALVTR